MYIVRAVLLFSFYWLMGWLGADVQADLFPTQEPPSGEYVIRIEGFLQYPETPFFQVSEKNAAITVKRIRTNAVAYYNTINRNFTRISYNPKLLEFKENVDYEVEDLSLILAGDLYFAADEVIANRSGGLEGFSRITDYFRVKRVSATATQKDTEYSVEFVKRIYDTTDFSIFASGDLYKIPNYIKSNIAMNNLQVSGANLRFSPKQLDILRSYVAMNGNTHWIIKEGGELDASTNYARENTNIQNIKFAPDTPPKPPRAESPPMRHKHNYDDNFRSKTNKPWKEDYTRQFWIALFCTIFIEVIVMILLVLNNTDFKVSNLEMAADVFVITVLGNGITVPVIWWIFTLPGLPYAIYAVVSLTFAILTEGWWYSMFLRAPFKKTILFSLAANLAAWMSVVMIFDYMLDWIL